MTEAKWIIRTSDRKAFKECRLEWDWNSKIRQNYEPNTEAQALRFGTAVHAGLADLHDSTTWGVGAPATRLALAQLAFVKEYPFQSWNGGTEGSEDEYAAYAVDLELGKGMLAHFVDWAADWHKTITPVHVEVEFEVPIPAPNAMPGRFGNSIDGDLLCDGMPVVYQGRIDMILRDQWGGYWIVDWKTAGRIEGSHEWLQMDEQITSYCWALQHALGIKIEGFLYIELLKALPHSPKVLKKGGLSVDKSQNTTEKVYLDTLAHMGYTDLSPYDEMLTFLRAQGNKFFRTTDVQRSPRELELIGERIGLESVDMLNDPSIYPNPSKFRCGRCAFKSPCLMRAEGSDFGWVLKDSFHVRGN